MKSKTRKAIEFVSKDMVRAEVDDFRLRRRVEIEIADFARCDFQERRLRLPRFRNLPRRDRSSRIHEMRRANRVELQCQQRKDLRALSMKIS